MATLRLEEWKPADTAAFMMSTKKRLIELLTRTTYSWSADDIALLQAECIRAHLEIGRLRKKNTERRKDLRGLNRAMAATKWQLGVTQQHYLQMVDALARAEQRNGGGGG